MVRTDLPSSDSTVTDFVVRENSSSSDAPVYDLSEFTKARDDYKKLEQSVARMDSKKFQERMIKQILRQPPSRHSDSN